MSYHLILPFFPEELRALLLDPSISDLMINGTTGVYADRNGVVQHIPLATPYTNDRLQTAIERVARILGCDHVGLLSCTLCPAPTRWHSAAAGTINAGNGHTRCTGSSHY